MADTSPRLYEGLYLIDQQAMAGDTENALAEVRNMLNRAGAEIVTLSKWDERRLAYTIKKQRRGLYLIAIFRVAPVQIANIERDCNLSDLVIRALMIRADHMGDLEIEAAVKDSQTAKDRSSIERDDNQDEDDDGEVEDAGEAAEESIPEEAVAAEGPGHTSN